ncbi:hypothetical protein ANN_20578 [Periplaneta americana]|uniref:Uncharacterized protein n=1 Tax=Periplaneta americana TaxID=6978 RepID=A0ABQ8SD31_PERAM|nr:hypothetical protein ANN_20578 [Periplaneta americana]
MHCYRQLTIPAFSVHNMKTSEMSFCVYHEGQAKKSLNEKRNHIYETHYTLQCLLHCLKTSNATAALCVQLATSCTRRFRHPFLTFSMHTCCNTLTVLHNQVLDPNVMFVLPRANTEENDAYKYLHYTAIK